MGFDGGTGSRGLRAAMVASVALALAACGGGGGGSNVRVDPPPASVPPPVVPSTPPVVEPANPNFGKHLALTGASSAHAAGITGAGVRIGVVDSGVNRNHPALQGRVAANLTYIGSPPNNLTVDDVVGHGTAVSQIMAGKPFGQWPGGIAPGATIVSARIISDAPPKDDGSGQGNEVSGALGLKPIHQDLIARGARIMNNSWGGLYWTNLNATAPIADEYRPFIFGNDGLVVFATGNSSFANPSDNAALPSKAGPNGTRPAADLERGWLAVAALDTNTPSQLASYSNACGVAMRYCLVAPGDVVTTGTNDKPTSPEYWNWRGTSFAAPQVSGAAALVWEKFPYFNNDLVRQTLLGTAKDLGAPGPDAVFGYGLLDVAKAIRGPARFDWGDATVNLASGTSTWQNDIEGAGGLTKQGGGTLVLAGGAFYTGTTRVLGGTLATDRRLNGAAVVERGATLRMTGSSGSVDNRGVLDIGSGGASFVRSIDGNYTQDGSARLSYLVGAPVHVGGTATLAGELQVAGIATGYVRSTTNRESVLFAFGGVSGAFGSLTSAPGVFLDARLGYDANAVWLDIARLDVAMAARSMGLSAASVASAQRVEGLFDAIDRGAYDALDDGRPSPLLEAAGTLQRTSDAAAAERTLASLSGELHGADATLALMAIDGHRHALESRLDAVRDGAGGAWAGELRSQRAASGFGLDARGWLLGQDRRIGDWLVGTAFGQTDAVAFHELRSDRERNRQVEGQLYAEWRRDGAYLRGRVASGRMDRRLDREVLLGGDSLRADAGYADRYATLDWQLGRRFGLDAASLTPYAGLQALRLDRGGFAERGAAGFGLAADGSSLSVTRALLGARFAREWTLGAARLDIGGHAEWQRVLGQADHDIDARFTAIDVRSPIVGPGFGQEAAVLAFDLGLWLPAGRLAFGLDGRRESGRSQVGALASWSTTF